MTADTDKRLAGRLFPLVVALGLLNGAVYVNHGLYSRPAVALLLSALVVFAHAALIRTRMPVNVVRGLVLVVVAAQAAMLLAAKPLNDLSPNTTWPHYLGYGLVSLGAMGMVALPRGTWLPRGAWLPLAGVGLTIASVWAFRSNPSPRVDVFYYQQLGSQALLQGHNPYTLTFPNPYGREENWVFAPGTVSDDRIHFGFPYMPVTLLGVLPGQLLGDYRYAHLGAILLAGWLLGTKTSPTTGPWSAALLLTFPRLNWVLEWGWTEPLLVALMVMSLVALARRKAPWLALALFIASKQYLALLLPLLRLAGGRRALVLTLLAASAITLPLALWNFPAFWSSAVTLQFAQPFRPDALSLPAMVYDLYGLKLPSWLPLAVTLLVASLLAARLPRTPRSIARSIAWSLAVTLPLLFVLSKQAFANYYFLVAAAWCAALAFDGASGEAEDLSSAAPST